MANLEDSNSTSSFDNSLVEIRGSDNTTIGNDGDRLKTQAKVSNIKSEPIYVRNTNYISTDNSTSTPLTANSTFTGTWEDVSEAEVITVTLFSSHASATLGFKYQTSSNGIDIDDGDTFNIPATAPGNAKVYSFGVTSRYFRIIFINGNINQTDFRLQTIIHFNNTKPSTHRVDDSIVDDDDATLTKSVITGKSVESSEYKNIATDDAGRVLISDLSSVVDPLDSIRIVERRVINPSIAYTTTVTATTNTTVKEFTFGGRGAGEGMFGIYDPSPTEYIPGGNFESSSDVSMWTNTGVGDGSALVLTYSTDQAFTGTGSLKLGPANRSDQNHYPQITYTWGSPISFDVWRYISARFYNFAPAGGAVTRTISIIITDSLGSTRTYSVSGLTNTSPFNTNQWIQILGEIRVPTSQTGTTFDINNIVSISLRMQDSGNKAYTAIYWDTVQFIGSLDIFQKIYTNGNTIQIKFDPVISINQNEIIYLALRNNDTSAKEYQLTLGGVEI